MRRFFRSKLFISIILLVMAALLTFVFLPKLYGSQSETIDIVQFIDDVNVGTKISPDMLATKTIGRYGGCKRHQDEGRNRRQVCSQ